MEREHPPYHAYAAIVATFVGGLSAAGAISRVLDRRPQCHTALDFAALSMAAFKAAHTLSRDEVTSFIRDPFTEETAHEGGEHPVHTGDLRQAIGELVTCSRCVGTWAAAALATTQIMAPRFGRLLTWSLGSAGANDFLLAAFAALARKANALEQQRA